MNQREWLNTPSGLTRREPFPGYLHAQPTNLEYLAELIYCNGGNFDYKSDQLVVMGVGCYWRTGLVLQEQMNLCQLQGCWAGVCLGSGEKIDLKLVQDEITRVEQAFLKSL